MAKKVLFEIEIDSNFQDLNKIEQSLTKLKKQRQELIKIQKSEKGLNKAQQQQLTKLNQQIKLQTGERRKLEKAVQQNARDSNNLTGAFERQNNRLKRLKKELLDTIVTESKMSAKTRGLSKDVNKLENELREAKAQASGLNGKMKGAQRGAGGFGTAMKGAALSTLGMVGGVTAVIGIVGDAISTIKDFEQGNANLASVLGKTSADIKALTEDAKRLGAQTSFSATQVTELQTEFAKLGFTEDQILAATEATLDLAAATGSDLAEAAAVAGATLGGFGLTADKTQNVTDIMAKSFSSSALDMTKFSESMKSAAPAAKAVGISVVETTALLGVLANAGISGSKAGNNLKTSFINLNNAGLTLDQGLAEVANSQDKLSTATKLVGKNAAASFLVLAEGREDISKLTEEFKNADGAASAMAKTQLDTLGGSLKILSSAWEGFILSLEDGSGLFTRITRIIIDDLAAGLGILSGNVEEATEKVSFFTFWFTSLKNAINIQIGLIKLLLTPWRVLIKLAVKLGQRFGILSESGVKFEKVLLKIQNIFIKLPQIIDIVIEEVFQGIDRIFAFFDGVAEAIEGVFSLNLSKIKSGGIRAASAFEQGFLDINRDIPERIIELFNSKPIQEAAKDAGKSIGENMSDGIKEGLKKAKDSKIEKIPERQSFKLGEEIGTDVSKGIGQSLDKSDFSDDKAKLFRLTDEEKKLAKEQGLKLAQETSDAIFSVQQQNADRQKQFALSELNARSQRSQDILQSQLEANLISQEEYENNRIALDERTQESKEKIEREAFNRNKKLQTAQAIANGALAITNILATVPKFDFGIASAIQIAASVASTAIQVATIQAQKFAKGGRVLSGKITESQNIPTQSNGDNVLATVRTGEVILNEGQQESLGGADTFRRIGVPGFANGGYVPKNNYIPAFAGGGVVSGGGGVSSQDLDRQAAQIIKGINDKRVINDPRSTINEFENAQSIENEFTI
jgi:hypothetical protein